MAKDKVGIYQIICLTTGRFYVGSSKRMYSRWAEHRAALRKDCAPDRLQNEWNKYGEGVFRFAVLEECPRNQLVNRETYWLNLLKPSLNGHYWALRSTDQQEDRRLSDIRAHITHCPYGHPFSPENTYVNRKGNRICRVCNALRVAAIYKKQSPEEREKRAAKLSASYYANHAERRAKQSLYTAANRKIKQEYDRTHRAEARSNRLKRIQNETPEQRSHRLEMQRVRYRRWQEKHAYFA